MNKEPISHTTKRSIDQYGPAELPKTSTRAKPAQAKRLIMAYFSEEALSIPLQDLAENTGAHGRFIGPFAVRLTPELLTSIVRIPYPQSVQAAEGSDIDSVSYQSETNPYGYSDLLNSDKAPSWLKPLSNL